MVQWHAVTAKKDIDWTEDLFKKIFPDKHPEDVQLSDFGKALGRSWATLVDPNPRTRTFAKYAFFPPLPPPFQT